MTRRDQSPWVVMKFGGTSVSSAAKWNTIAEVVSWRVDEGVRPLIVCSALTGVSDQLERLVEAATWGKHESVIQPCHRGAHGDLARRSLLGGSRPSGGDVILIANTGAYGRAMSSHYNLRSPAEEVAI